MDIDVDVSKDMFETDEETSTPVKLSITRAISSLANLEPDEAPGQSQDKDKLSSKSRLTKFSLKKKSSMDDQNNGEQRDGRPKEPSTTTDELGNSIPDPSPAKKKKVCDERSSRAVSSASSPRF